jgi:NADH-quinone oxidoreductase subunit E
MQKKIENMIKPHEGEKGSLIPILQAVQKECGYISEEAIAAIAKDIKLSEHEIYGVATFYAQFRFTKPGDHLIKVCVGTACYVKGNSLNLVRIKNILGIEEGEVTSDYRFGLETVNCLGACALAPLVTVDEEYHGKFSPIKLKKILSKYAEEKAGTEDEED